MLNMFQHFYNCMIRFHCSEPGSGGVVQSGDRLPSERPLFKTMFQDVWACYHWCFIFDLLRPTCLFTSGEEHFVNLLQARLVWMVRLSLCGGAEISWTFICFQKTAKKKKVGTMRAVQRENNGFAEEVFLDSHTHSGVMWAAQFSFHFHFFFWQLSLPFLLRSRRPTLLCCLCGLSCSTTVAPWLLESK